MRKISKAPRPIGSLPTGHTTPEPAPDPAAKSEPKQPTESYYRFLRAIRRGDRREAEFYAQKCRDEGLPETQLKELSLLDIYQTRSKRGPEPTKKLALEKAMWAYIREKEPDEFLKMKKEQLAAHFKASPTTAWEVRNAIKSRLMKTPTIPTNSDRQ
jgi:hypothetical protein